MDMIISFKDMSVNLIKTFINQLKLMKYVFCFLNKKIFLFIAILKIRLFKKIFTEKSKNIPVFEILRTLNDSYIYC